MSATETEIAIVGGGLAGLALADRLEQAGRDYHVFEARQRWGGRIRTLEAGGGAFDLGPSWFWPGQPLLAALTRRFRLDVFEQYATGAQLYEDGAGGVHRGRGYASMAGSWRIGGGTGRLIERLVAALPDKRLHAGAAVRAVSADEGIELADGIRVRARTVVLALPPRLALSLRFDPPLPDTVLRELADIPTWMAGQAKFVAVYSRPFWRAAGLSGDAMSHHGPLIEIHDASPADGRPGALFGFVGVPPDRRRDRTQALTAAALHQLERLFGAAAGNPIATRLADWAFCPETAAEPDRTGPAMHPDGGLPVGLESLWHGRLLLAGSEADALFGGYMEGALQRAETVAARIEQSV